MTTKWLPWLQVSSPDMAESNSSFSQYKEIDFLEAVKSLSTDPGGQHAWDQQWPEMPAFEWSPVSCPVVTMDVLLFSEQRLETCCFSTGVVRS